MNQLPEHTAVGQAVACQVPGPGYNNVYWPTMYLIDKTGRIHYKHIGEGNYDVTDGMIRTLLTEAPQ